MSRWMIGLSLATLVLVVGAWSLYGQPRPGEDPSKKEKRTINTSGTATIKVKPDHARVYFAVQSLASTVKEARTDNSLKVKKVLDALTALKITDLKMKTTDVHVEIVQSQVQQDKLPQILGYRITNSFTVLIKDDDADKLNANAGKVLDTALENGANSVSQVQFFKSDLTDVRRQVLGKAVQEALMNARALGAAAGIAHVDIVAINGEPNYGVYGFNQSMGNRAQVAFGGAEGGGELPVMAGEVEVTCNVSVTCSF